MLITRTYKETAKVSKQGHTKLEEFLLFQQQLYNAALQERESYYRATGESITLYKQYNSLTIIRDEIPEYKQYGVHAVRSALRRIDRGFKSFFRRVKEGAKKPGYPRYKSRNRMRSFDCPVGGFTIRETGNRWAVRIKGLEPFIVKSIPEGKIKELRIVKTAKRITIQFVVEKEIDVTPSKVPFIGIDLGIESLITLSNGKKIPGRNRKLERQKKRQRKLQVNARKGSKQKAKTKGSNSYKKARALYSKECQTVKERELGFMHMLTSAIVSKHPNLVIEDLRITNMVKNHSLARRILEQSWGTFKRLLEYKAESAGGQVITVSPRNTSRACSDCGSVKEALSLSERVYKCSVCGLHIDRDLNAARNILQLGCPSDAAGYEAAGFEDVDYIDGDLLRWGGIERSQNSMLNPFGD